jgi:hypothetical protein
MNYEKELFIKSRAYKYFNDEVKKDKTLRDSLISLEELLNIKKNIRQIYNTDNPKEIIKLIGMNINGIMVSKKDVKYAEVISNTYNIIYEKCKILLNNVNGK